jgi:hypothetical protein
MECKATAPGVRLSLFNFPLSTVDCKQKEINELWLLQRFIMPGYDT